VSGCLFVCLYPINVKTAEPIGPKLFVVPRLPKSKFYGKQKNENETISFENNRFSKSF